MRITTKGRYAVTAMLDLAYHSQHNPVTLNDIATRQTISISYLEQLFARLRRADLVTGVRGPGGGYQLSRDPKEISVAQIIFAVDEPLDSTQCRGEGNCDKKNNQPCLTHDLWMGLSHQIHQYLEGISLAEILARRPEAQTEQTVDVRSVAKNV
ncbi:MAG: Fe-S cluster assembly transcriptional regulator IscR [Pseudomonadota bacterium]|jgi:Rrf2 family iron-sulfur cluster assembly transcriptional regulator